jgi:NAD(P)-dependent dehydrogenase (short-subunit alcohol dehydrogenase family)
MPANGREHTQPVWLITGCSSGFGRALAQCLLQQGFRVVVTARNADDVADLVSHHTSASVLCLELDVSDTSQISRAVRTTLGHWGGIDVLVNNAGVGYIGAIEEGEGDAIRRLFDTNFHGAAGLIRAVLPGMRARGSGCIVNISSIAGLVGFPGMGYYCATKFALEGLSESLAAEINPLGLRVVLVEPGPYRTDFFGRSLRQAQAQFQDYADSTANARRMSVRHGSEGGDPLQVAHAIIAATSSPELFVRVPLGEGIAELVEHTFRTRLLKVRSGRGIHT